VWQVRAVRRHLKPLNRLLLFGRLLLLGDRLRHSLRPGHPLLNQREQLKRCLLPRLHQQVRKLHKRLLHRRQRPLGRRSEPSHLVANRL
jgi:hypothetical protein